MVKKMMQSARDWIVEGFNWMIRDREKNFATEEQEQIAFVQWLKLKKVLFYHVPNGGSRNLLEAAKLKRMGTTSGVPDICIPVANGKYHALYIEIKRKPGGRLTSNQQQWIDILNLHGNCAVVAYGCDDAIKITSNYFSWR